MSTHSIRRIGVLTGGGDCPGLNAVIRSITLSALNRGVEVMGIRDGYLGLIEDRMEPLLEETVEDILLRGGTILGTSNKANPSKFVVGKHPDGSPLFGNVIDRCLATIERRRLDALLLVGGDGTMAGAEPLIKAGINCIGVPKTIDNDLEGTDLTFGFLTAVSVAAEAMDRVFTTALSHQRVIAVEVMGRNSGWISLFAGAASGAPVILLPEVPFDWESVYKAVMERRTRGRMSCVICVSEGACPRDGKQVVARVDPTSPDPIRLGGIAQMVAGEVEKATGVESRYVVLGHVQRGGTPEPADRILGTQFGHRALEILLNGKRNRLVGRRGFEEVDIDILSVVGKQRKVPLDHAVMSACRSVGVSFGD
jgi:phosphofructokinase-like protein